jgi:hypothetical protein
MDVTAFTHLALTLPDATQSSHLGSTDFRVNNKIFAQPAAGPAGWAIVKLTRDQQEMRCSAEPALFAPEPGHWGRCGWTRFNLGAADTETALDALWAAWRNVAPKKLVDAHPAPPPVA